MSLKVTMQDQTRLRTWAAPYMGVTAEELASDMVLMGVLRDGEPIAAVGFNAFYGDQAAIHVASNGRRDWINRAVLRMVFGYAFSFRNLRRLNLLVPVWNRDAQILALKSGGLPEGYMRKAASDGSDAALFGILREDCPYFSMKPITGGLDGQEIRT